MTAHLEAAFASLRSAAQMRERAIPASTWGPEAERSLLAPTAGR